jgi:hypothetical protein
VALAVRDVGLAERRAALGLELVHHHLERRSGARPEVPQLGAIGAFERPDAALGLEVEGVAQVLEVFLDSKR